MKHKGTVMLETERLILRKFTENDAEAVFWNWASDDEVTKYLTWPTHRSVENSAGYIDFCLETYKEDDSYQWGIELKETGELFGNISVVKTDDDLNAVELGYVIGRRFWGNGYMAEAVKAVIDFLFEEVDVNRIAARHDVNNPNSGKVMQKAGMKYEGTLRQADRNNQGIVDCAIYSVLKSEYICRQNGCGKAMDNVQTLYEELEPYFIRGDIAGAIAFMKGIPELNDVVQAYIEVFENEQYIQYDIPDDLNRILLCYQQYFRDVFYLHIDHAQAESDLFEKLKQVLDLPDGAIEDVENKMKFWFNRAGYEVLFGKTNGYRGPYVWKETESVTFEVELPETTSIYSINMLRGFIMRGWMDYLTFSEKGTGGWTSPDGTINCVEKAYDVNSERFIVSLLKHEAQHSEDFKRWGNMESKDLEYRAKLVEMIYTQETNLLAKFCSEANLERTDDGHALASARIKSEMGDLVSADIAEIQMRARFLFTASSEEMDRVYGRNSYI